MRQGDARASSSLAPDPMWSFCQVSESSRTTGHSTDALHPGRREDRCAVCRCPPGRTSAVSGGARMMIEAAGRAGGGVAVGPCEWDEEAGHGLVGRDTELERILRGSGPVQGASPRGLLLLGEEGIGRTRLLRAAREQAARRGALVLSAHGWAGDRERPYSRRVPVARLHRRGDRRPAGAAPAGAGRGGHRDAGAVTARPMRPCRGRCCSCSGTLPPTGPFW